MSDCDEGVPTLSRMLNDFSNMLANLVAAAQLGETGPVAVYASELTNSYRMALEGDE